MDWFLVLGYLIFTIYTCLIMFFGAILEKKTSLDKTICRKITHIISAFVWVICYFFFGCSIHWIIVNGVGTILLGLGSFSGKFKFFDSDNSKSSIGLFYFALSTFIVALICFLIGSELYLYAGISYFCLALGDGFAPIVAKVFKDKNKIIRPGKSVLGTLSVFLVSFLSTLVFSTIFNMQLSILFILSIASLTTIAEFYGVKGLDNIFIEFLVFGYLLLYHYGLVGLPLQIVLTISPLLAVVAIGSKSMTTGGGICAFILFFLVGFFGKDFVPTIFIFALFFISTIVAVISKHLDKKVEENKKSNGRKANQIIAVGLFGILSLIIHYYSGVRLFYYLFFLSFVEQFADSMASDIGRLTKKKNVSIITFKPVEKGISGGVSLLGTSCALLGSLLLMLIPYFFNEVTFKFYISIALLAFLGTVVDSIIGAIFQALYRCNVCSKLIECPIHCDGNAELLKGFRIIDNTAVNYIASFVTCMMGFILLVL